MCTLFLFGITIPNQARAEALTSVNATLLENAPERIRNQAVRVQCSYSQLYNSYVDSLPSVQVETNGIMTVVNTHEQEKWFGIWCRDGVGESFTGTLMLKKDDFLDHFLAMKKGTPLIIEGVVISLKSTDKHAVIVSKVMVGKSLSSTIILKPGKKNPVKKTADGLFKIDGQFLENAPEKLEGFFAVPKVVE